jgi:hypothetical protein
MPSWTPITDLLAEPLLLATAAGAFTLLASLESEPPDEGETWGDDPAVLALLSGMSL